VDVPRGLDLPLELDNLAVNRSFLLLCVGTDTRIQCSLFIYPNEFVQLETQGER
jgi:hypothetical protein